MRILILNDYATPVGGAEIGTLILRDGLRERGHDARVFASSAGAAPGASFADYSCFGTLSRFRTLLQSANPWAPARLGRVLEEFRPDVVHVRMFLTQLSPLILPQLARIPSLYHAVWYRAVCPTGLKQWPNGLGCDVVAGVSCVRHGCVPARDLAPLMLQMRMWRKWRRVFRRIVANSEAVRRQLVAGGVEPVEVIWNGVPARSARPPLSDPPTVAFAGRLVREKGVDLLFRAFAEVARQIPTARLLVAGEGLERSRLEALAETLGIAPRLAMLGHLPQADMDAALGAAWVHAVPSQIPEPFGYVAAEAMMRGTAVVATAAGGLPELVQDGKTGVLVPMGDVAALRDALLRLLQDRALAESMGRAGREAALASFSAAGCVERFLEVYRAIA